MHLTVEEALSIYPLSEAKLIAGANGRHRVVKSINVMDAPDISDWIKEGEMLLTTAYLIKDNLEEASALLHTLDRRGSAGLAIKPGRFWDAIPERLVEEADRLNFPLIELPFQFTFSDQMNGLFRAELERNTNVLQHVLEKQRKLMRFALRLGQGTPLFDSVSGVVGHPLAVVSSRGTVIYNNSDHGDPELLAGWPWTPRSQRIRLGDGAAFRTPLLQGDECTGYLIYCAVNPLYLPAEESLYVQGAELISFHVQAGGEDYSEHDANREFGSLLRRCLAGALPHGELMQAASKLGIGLLDGPYMLQLTDAHAGGEFRQGEMLRLKEEFMQHPYLNSVGGLHIVAEDGLISLYPAQGVDNEKLRAAVEEGLRNLKYGEGYSPRAVISSRKTRPEGLKEAWAELKECMAASAYWVQSGQRAILYRQLELTLLLRQIPAEAMQRYCSRSLGGLMGKEPEYAREMLRTLEVYLESDGHVNETAKRLFIHRNTATYRIEKLSEMLDIDFKNMNDLLRMKLVFLFKGMLERD